MSKRVTNESDLTVPGRIFYRTRQDCSKGNLACEPKTETLGYYYKKIIDGWKGAAWTNYSYLFSYFKGNVEPDIQKSVIDKINNIYRYTQGNRAKGVDVERTYFVNDKNEKVMEIPEDSDLIYKLKLSLMPVSSIKEIFYADDSGQSAGKKRRNKKRSKGRSNKKRSKRRSRKRFTKRR